MKKAGVSGVRNLVIATVVPIGTRTTLLNNQLRSQLENYGYEVEELKVSRYLVDLAPASLSIPDEPEVHRANALMVIGDAVCEQAENGAAALGVAAQPLIRGFKSVNGQRRAWIIDSIKRPEEIIFLRETLGDRAIVVGAQSGAQERLKLLRALIEQSLPPGSQALAEDYARSLVQRDLDGKGAYGQNILDTFPMADVFVDVDGDIARQVERFFDLLFDNPIGRLPTKEEYGMRLAYTTSFTSGELGRRVGASIMRDFDVVSTGANMHPITDHAVDVDTSKADLLDLLGDTLSRLGVRNLEFVSDDDFLDGGWLNKSARGRLYEVLQNELKGGEFTALTEFQSPVHAEMNAILCAASHRSGLESTHLFVTDYPCHNCAKHILRLGLEVTFLQPYPKSRAEAMYGTNAARSFTPFTGIHPRHFDRFFSSRGDRMNDLGKRKVWRQKDRYGASPKGLNWPTQRMVLRGLEGLLGESSRGVKGLRWSKIERDISSQLRATMPASPGQSRWRSSASGAK